MLVIKATIKIDDILKKKYFWTGLEKNLELDRSYAFLRAKPWAFFFTNFFELDRAGFKKKNPCPGTWLFKNLALFLARPGVFFFFINIF